jgi:hypothetical protein
VIAVLVAPAAAWPQSAGVAGVALCAKASAFSGGGRVDRGGARRGGLVSWPRSQMAT